MTKDQNPPELEWKQEYETGNAEIDHEHRQMIERLNGFLMTVRDGGPTNQIIEELGEVHAWISAHFALEENIMRARNYDQFQDHKEDHERLLDDIRDIMDDCQEGKFDNLGDKLRQRVEEWFVGHFKTRDSRLHRLIRHEK